MMRVIVILYLFVGAITCASITGHGVWLGESIWFVVGGNVLLLGLFVLGVVHARRQGKFLGCDRRLWIIATLGGYVVGVVLNIAFPRA